MTVGSKPIIPFSFECWNGSNALFSTECNRWVPPSLLTCRESVKLNISVTWKTVLNRSNVHPYMAHVNWVMLSGWNISEWRLNRSRLTNFTGQKSAVKGLIFLVGPDKACVKESLSRLRVKRETYSILVYICVAVLNVIWKPGPHWAIHQRQNSEQIHT